MTVVSSFSINSLLSCLDAAEMEQLVAHSSLVPLYKNVDIGHPDTTITYCWFPLSGLVSVIAMDADGGEAEVGIIGRDGCVNATVAIGETHHAMRLLVQLPGEALRIEAAVLLSLAHNSPELLGLLQRYTQAFSIQVASSALAFARYSIPKRLARWLLMANDRVEGDIGMVHDALAVMLGVRRAGVTEALHSLERKGAIHAQRGKIVITSRERLLEIAASGYGIPEASYARLLMVGA